MILTNSLQKNCVFITLQYTNRTVFFVNPRRQMLSGGLHRVVCLLLTLAWIQ
jgi:hypothetical protein